MAGRMQRDTNYVELLVTSRELRGCSGARLCATRSCWSPTTSPGGGGNGTPRPSRRRRKLQVAAQYLTDMRKKAGLTQAEVAEAMGVSQQRVSAIESGSVAELATLADYIHALGGELKVIADFGDSWQRVA